MRTRLLIGTGAAIAVAACIGTSTSTTNTCPATDDAGAFDGSLYTLTAGNLTIDYDAGNGGVDLGPVKLADGGLGHVYEWPCIETYDCATPRDASITFESPNGVSDWTVVSMNFDNGSNCATAVVDAGTCCVSCMATSPGSLPCGNSCISNAVTCLQPAGCACP
jgi:hypothetical protein